MTDAQLAAWTRARWFYAMTGLFPGKTIPAWARMLNESEGAVESRALQAERYGFLLQEDFWGGLHQFRVVGWRNGR